MRKPGQRHHQRDRHRGDAVQIAEHQILIRMQILAEHNADGSDAGEAHPGAHFLHHVEAGAEGQPRPISGIIRIMWLLKS